MKLSGDLRCFFCGKPLSEIGVENLDAHLAGHDGRAWLTQTLTWLWIMLLLIAGVVWLVTHVLF